MIGATGQQGGAVVRALQASGQFKVRALTRNPGKHRELAEEVVEADLDHPETLKAAFEGAHGVFLVANFWEEGTDELKQASVEAISGGKFHVPHFTGKAKIDRIVKEVGFAHHTFVIAFFFYQNLVGSLAPQKQETEPWAGLFLLTQLCGAFTWATSPNSATSWPAHSLTRIRQAMGSIWPWSVIL